MVPLTQMSQGTSLKLNLFALMREIHLESADALAPPELDPLSIGG